jgi:hypothetical protein
VAKLDRITPNSNAGGFVAGIVMAVDPTATPVPF